MKICLTTLSPIVNADVVFSIALLWNIGTWGNMSSRTGLDRVLNLPPFWLAFAFVALVSLPMSYVAMPIAAAPMGALPAIAIIVVVTFIMCLSTAAIAEAVVALPAEKRPTNLRDLSVAYLGTRIGNVTAIAIAIVFFAVLVACLVSIASTLSYYTGMSEEMWLAVVSASILIIISVGNVAHSLSLIAGAVALVLIISILVALAPFINLDRLLFAQIPFTDNRGAAPELWSGFLGVSILSFIGPLLLVPSATYVLPNNPDATQYIRGSLWGIVLQGVLMVLWITLVELSVLPTELIGLHGTVFLKLGEITDGFVKAAGTALVFILPGLAAIRSAAQLGVLIRLFLTPEHQSTSTGARVVWSYIVPAIPSVAAMVLVAILIEENEANVAAFLSIGGILGSSIATGIVPALMYRRVMRITTAPPVQGLRVFRSQIALLSSSLFFSIVLLLYGLLVWDSLPTQALACMIAGVNLVYVLWHVRLSV